MSAYKEYQTKKVHDLREMLHTSAAVYRHKPAFYQKTDGEYKPIGYTNYYRDVAALGEDLLDSGFEGKRIMLLGENCYNWCLSYMTVINGLGVIVPVDKELPPEEISNIAVISEASAIIYSDKYESKLEKLEESVERISFSSLESRIEHGRSMIAEGDRSYLELSIDIDAMCALIFTSGTVGVSKGVMLSQRNICTNIYNLGKMIKVEPDTVALSVLPLHHVYECNCGFLFSVYKGGTYAFSEGIRYVTKNMKEIHPTKMLCVPMLIETMYKKIWSNIRKKGIEEKVRRVISVTNSIEPYSLRMAAKRKMFAEIHESLGGRMNLLVSGGAPIDAEIIRGMQDFGFRVIQGYGLTECAPLAAVNHDKHFNNRSAGLALPGGELEICDPAEDGTGEIKYRGDNVMLGYYNQPELTAQVKRNGWLYTGDIGYIDNDGFLVITGRKKNVIVTSNGKNVFPEELESYLSRCDMIAESVVVGIMNEKKKDYDIVAVIRPDYQQIIEHFGKEYSPIQVEAAIKKAVDGVNGLVQSYKNIDMFIIRDEELPKNSSRKIKRTGIVELIMDDYLAKLKR